MAIYRSYFVCDSIVEHQLPRSRVLVTFRRAEAEEIGERRPLLPVVRTASPRAFAIEVDREEVGQFKFGSLYEVDLTPVEA